MRVAEAAKIPGDPARGRRYRAITPGAGPPATARNAPNRHSKLKNIRKKTAAPYP
jgi:hypothetical protein